MSYREGQHDENLTKLRRERDAWLERVALFGRLFNMKPDIADFINGSQPKKIGERYMALYDKQWTDAYVLLKDDGLDLESAIKTLLDILIMIYGTCSREAEIQLDALTSFGAVDVTKEDMKTVLDNRKGNYKEYIEYKREDVKKNVYKEVKNLRRSKTMDEYIDLCLELCWLISIQDPPMILDTQTDRHGSEFHKDYGAFRTTGHLLDYVVWSALYLNKDGPMVAKGIAQIMVDKGNTSGPGFKAS